MINDTNVLSTFLMTYSIMINLFTLALAVLTIIAMWKIFEKAHEEGWKSLIPIYNGYVLAKISGATKIWWAEFVLTILLTISMIALMVNTFGLVISSGMNEIPFSGEKMVGSILIIALVMFVIAIIELVLNIIIYARLAKSFGKSTAFTVGLVFIPNIFFLILGFDSSQYIGPNGTGHYNQTLQN